MDAPDDTSFDFTGFSLVVIFKEVLPCRAKIRRVMIVNCCDEIEARIPDAVLFAKRGQRR